AGTDRDSVITTVVPQMLNLSTGRVGEPPEIPPPGGRRAPPAAFVTPRNDRTLHGRASAGTK
ncbi:hypothetical protein ACFV2T_38050, partial [Streptomyces sp. NPDC059651]